MAIKRCPFCGHEEDDNKEFRLSIFLGDQRIAIIPQGTASFSDVNKIVKGTPDAYLMQETLDSKGRMIFSRVVGESRLVTFNGNLIERPKS